MPRRPARHSLAGTCAYQGVRKTEDLCIVQPFSPNLFSHGELIGPHTFLEVHREKLTLPEAKARFEKDKPNKQKNRDILLFCRGCSPQPHLQEKLLPLREFVSAWAQRNGTVYCQTACVAFAPSVKRSKVALQPRGSPRQ